MSKLLLGVGLVLCIEGIAFALLPRRLDDLAEMLRRMPPDLRRAIGLGSLAVGVVLVWISELVGG